MCGRTYGHSYRLKFPPGMPAKETASGSRFWKLQPEAHRRSRQIYYWRGWSLWHCGIPDVLKSRMMPYCLSAHGIPLCALRLRGISPPGLSLCQERRGRTYMVEWWLRLRIRAAASAAAAGSSSSSAHAAAARARGGLVAHFFLSRLTDDASTTRLTRLDSLLYYCTSS